MQPLRAADRWLLYSGTAALVIEGPGLGLYFFASPFLLISPRSSTRLLRDLEPQSAEACLYTGSSRAAHRPNTGSWVKRWDA